MTAQIRLDEAIAKVEAALKDNGIVCVEEHTGVQWHEASLARLIAKALAAPVVDASRVPTPQEQSVLHDTKIKHGPNQWCDRVTSHSVTECKALEHVFASPMPPAGADAALIDRLERKATDSQLIMQFPRTVELLREAAARLRARPQQEETK